MTMIMRIHARRYPSCRTVTGSFAGLIAATALLLSVPAPAKEAVQDLGIAQKIGQLSARIDELNRNWGGSAPEVNQGMYLRSGKAVEAARGVTRIEPVAEKTWIIYTALANAVLLETKAGLVLIDAGPAPAGPAILEAIRSVSRKPLHTLIYTHGHSDHAYGSWAFLEAGERPEIIAHENVVVRMRNHVLMRGNYAKLLPQPLGTMPASLEELPLPTRTFRDRLELEIGGERFVLQHRRGETDDHLYVWMPDRRIVASGDFWFGFLPNAGNGRRVQRYPEEWAAALEEMTKLGAELLLPSHGKPIVGGSRIREELMTVADALRYIADYTKDALNRGLPKHEIVEQFVWPGRFASDPRLRPVHAAPEDIVKMLIKQYTGWWSGLLADWKPAPLRAQAQEIVRLAGGMEPLLARTRQLLESDPALALHLAQWAWLAEPEQPEVRRVYAEALFERGMRPGAPIMEISGYIQALAELGMPHESAQP